MKTKDSQRKVVRAGSSRTKNCRVTCLSAGATKGTDSGKTILIIEDNHDILNVMSNVLAFDHYTVLKAASGECAIEVWKEQAQSIDLVIADVVLPGITGLEVVDLFRQQRPELEVIVMSGFLPEILRAHINPVNATSFLEKPFSAQMLRKAVQDRLSCASQ